MILQSHLTRVSLSLLQCLAALIPTDPSATLFSSEIKVVIDPSSSSGLPCLTKPKSLVRPRWGNDPPHCCSSSAVRRCLRDVMFMVSPEDRRERARERKLATGQVHELADCAVGDVINAIDAIGDWWTCRILEQHNKAGQSRSVKVHYPGWESAYDETFLLDSPAVAPHQAPQSWCLRVDQCIEKDLQPILWPILLVEPFSLNFNSLLKSVYDR